MAWPWNSSKKPEFFVVANHPTWRYSRPTTLPGATQDPRSMVDLSSFKDYVIFVLHIKLQLLFFHGDSAGPPYRVGME